MRLVVGDEFAEILGVCEPFVKPGAAARETAGSQQNKRRGRENWDYNADRAEQQKQKSRRDQDILFQGEASSNYDYEYRKLFFRGFPEGGFKRLQQAIFKAAELRKLVGSEILQRFFLEDMQRVVER